MKKLTALILALVMMLTATAALAMTLEPEETEVEHFAGGSYNATLGIYVPAENLMDVIVFETDLFEKEDVEKLQAGDVVMLNGTWQKVASIEKTEDGWLVKDEKGGETYFAPYQDSDDKLYAMAAEDDRICVHTVAQFGLPLAQDCVLEDLSDLEAAEAKITRGIEEIVKEKEKLEKESIGLMCRNTTITLNDQMEISYIKRVYNPAQ